MPDNRPPTDVSSYAEAVRGALSSLPEAEREVLLEDLESHLAEVASESEASLQERLGTPEAYAAELKLAYGSAGETPRTKKRDALLGKASELVGSVAGTRTYKEMRVLLPELLPGWWVLRAYLIVLFLAFVFRGGDNLRPIPNPFTKLGLLEILAMAIGIVVSVRIGRRHLPDSKVWLVAAVAANVAIVALALPVLVALSTGGGYQYYGGDASTSYLTTVQAGGYIPGVTNIYPYSSDGKPLKCVLLYDQDGRPLVVDTSAKPEVTTNVPIGADGLPIPNCYPLDQRDPSGQTLLPPRVALPPAPSPSASASPTPTPKP